MLLAHEDAIWDTSRPINRVLSKKLEGEMSELVAWASYKLWDCPTLTLKENHVVLLTIH